MEKRAQTMIRSFRVVLALAACSFTLFHPGQEDSHINTQDPGMIFEHGHDLPFPSPVPMGTPIQHEGMTFEEEALRWEHDWERFIDHLLRGAQPSTKREVRHLLLGYKDKDPNLEPVPTVGLSPEAVFVMREFEEMWLHTHAQLEIQAKIEAPWILQMQALMGMHVWNTLFVDYYALTKEAGFVPGVDAKKILSLVGTVTDWYTTQKNTEPFDCIVFWMPDENGLKRRWSEFQEMWIDASLEERERARSIVECVGNKGVYMVGAYHGHFPSLYDSWNRGCSPHLHDCGGLRQQMCC